MTDDEVQARIEKLEHEERQLRADEGKLAGEGPRGRVGLDASRLDSIRVELDQLWDYLRQRRALREAGQDPDEAQMRDSGTVEDYWG
jgi:hypothetical protein